MPTATSNLIVVESAKLRSAVQRLSPLCKANNYKPILRCIRLTFAGGKCRASATDLEIGAVAEFDCEGEFDTVVPAMFLQKVCEFASDELAISVDDAGAAEFKSGRSKWKTPTEPAAEFPAVKVEQAGFCIGLSARWLKGALGGTIYAADKDGETTRYALAGVLIEIQGGAASVIACDGRRACVTTTPLQGVDIAASGILPHKAAQYAMRSMPDDGECSVSITPNDFRLKCGDIAIYSRQIEGRFPKWRDIFPAQKPKRSSIPTDIFRRAIESVAFATNEESVGVDFDYRGGELVLSAKSQNGVAEGAFPIATELESSTLNPHYVSDFIRQSAGDEIMVQLATDGMALFESNGFRYVIAPLARDR